MPPANCISIGEDTYAFLDRLERGDCWFKRETASSLSTSKTKTVVEISLLDTRSRCNGFAMIDKKRVLLGTHRTPRQSSRTIE